MEEIFNLKFDSASDLYFAGQEIKGTLVISNSILTRMQKIGVTILGETRTHWNEKRHGNMVYESSESHFNQLIDLTSNLNFVVDSDSTSRELHFLKFSFALPATLPSSFESNFGYTRYMCVGKVELVKQNHHMIVCEATEYSCERKFFVLAAIPLGHYKGADAAVFKEDVIKNAGCLGCKQNFKISLALPTGEVSLGSSIAGILKIKNESKRPLSTLSLTLSQQFLLEAQTQSNEAGEKSTKMIECILACRNLETVKPGKISEFEFQLLTPEAVPPTQLEHIVRIQYKVNISICKPVRYELSVPIVLSLSQ